MSGCHSMMSGLDARTVAARNPHRPTPYGLASVAARLAISRPPREPVKQIPDPCGYGKHAANGGFPAPIRGRALRTAMNEAPVASSTR